MNFEDLTEDQKAKARAAKTPEDVLTLAREEGYELTDDELEAVSGGWCATDCTNDCKSECGMPYMR